MPPRDSEEVQTHREKVLVGFAGSLADCITLTEELEKMIEKYKGFELLKPCLELSKIWRTNREYKGLSATLLVAGKDGIVEMDSHGNVILNESVRGIGSGGEFAETAAEALLAHTEYDCSKIAEEAMNIAGRKCTGTNLNFVRHRVVWEI